MKVVILAGGFGTRISEESMLKPKPMIEIGSRPILWHIMKTYSHWGYNDFVILCGYKAYCIKEYFANYFLHQSDVTIDIATNQMEIHRTSSEKWKITVLDTGLHTMTGGRIKRAQPYIGNNTFMLTYGDGVSNMNINKLVDFHKVHKKTVTMTSVKPAGRFGALHIESDNSIVSFKEKPQGDGAWINGGFFVCNPQVFDYIAGDEVTFEREPLENLANKGELMAMKHFGFWSAMDTLRDKNRLSDLWNSGDAPWKVW